jgi:hypothetical protein
VVAHGVESDLAAGGDQGAHVLRSHPRVLGFGGRQREQLLGERVPVLLGEALHCLADRVDRARVVRTGAHFCPCRGRKGGEDFVGPRVERRLQTLEPEPLGPLQGGAREKEGRSDPDTAQDRKSHADVRGMVVVERHREWDALSPPAPTDGLEQLRGEDNAIAALQMT